MGSELSITLNLPKLRKRVLYIYLYSYNYTIILDCYCMYFHIKKLTFFTMILHGRDLNGFYLKHKSKFLISFMEFSLAAEVSNIIYCIFDIIILTFQLCK